MQSTLSVYVHLTACIFLICSQLFLQPCLLLSYWENFAYNQEPKIKILKYNNGERESQKKNSSNIVHHARNNNNTIKSGFEITNAKQTDLFQAEIKKIYLHCIWMRVT